MARRARLIELGLRGYREVWDLQRALHARVAGGEEPDSWIVVEHTPVITLGRNTKREHLLVSPELLAARGVDCFEVERGGDVTYHGPGQVVVYPILRLPRFREVVPLVTALESAAIDACAAFGVTAERWSEHRGIYVGRDQICAIGLAVRKMTSMHGIAFNACTALDYDRLITPCGISDRGITSLSRETRRHVSFEEAKGALLGALATTFALTFDVVDVGGAIPAAAFGFGVAS
jgi:lipoate-protein ligase B